MFKNFSLNDDEVIYIINNYEKLIKNNSYINSKLDEDLEQEIIIEIYLELTKNRKN